VVSAVDLLHLPDFLADEPPPNSDSSHAPTTILVSFGPITRWPIVRTCAPLDFLARSAEETSWH
jgi:hypothetical protein